MYHIEKSLCQPKVIKFKSCAFHFYTFVSFGNSNIKDFGEQKSSRCNKKTWDITFRSIRWFWITNQFILQKEFLLFCKRFAAAWLKKQKKQMRIPPKAISSICVVSQCTRQFPIPALSLKTHSYCWKCNKPIFSATFASRQRWENGNINYVWSITKQANRTTFHRTLHPSGQHQRKVNRVNPAWFISK